MLYIITEDSKSGYEFWKMVFGAYFDSEDYSIKSAGGNKYLRKCFDDSLSTCKESQDAILLIFDNIGNTSNFNPGNMIDHCKRNCEEKGVTFYHSDFYCFESIFLSYKEMLNMTANCKSDIKSVVEYVNSAINRGYGYWEHSCNSEITPIE